MNEITARARDALTGPIASVRIPFTRDGFIDFAGLDRYIDYCIDGGSRTVMLTHGDSLYSLLTHSEIADVTRSVYTRARGRASVCAATGIWSTPEAKEFAEFCSDLGIDMLMALPPDWARSCNTEDFVEYYATLADILPIMLVTNVFKPRGDAFGLGTIERVRDEVTGVVAVKDDLCGDFGQKLSTLVYGSWAVLVGGQKRNHMNVVHHGADGFLSTFISFKADVATDYWSAIGDSDYEKAQRIIDRYEVPFFDFITPLPGGFDSGMHGVYELVGRYGRWRRKPYRSLTDAEMKNLAELCAELSII